MTVISDVYSLTRVVVGNVTKKGKIWKVLLLEIFSLLVFNPTLSIYTKGFSYKFLFDTKSVDYLCCHKASCSEPVSYFLFGAIIVQTH